MINLPLKDIKPNVEIVDYNWYFFWIVVILVLIFVLFKLLRKKRDEDLQKLKNLSFEDSKKFAYEFTRLAYKYVNEKNRLLFEEIVKDLEKYKYKPEVPAIDNDLKGKVKEFLRSIK